MKASDTTFGLSAVADACANTDIPDDVVEVERLIAAAKVADAELHGLMGRLCGTLQPDIWNRCPHCGRALAPTDSNPHRRRGCLTAGISNLMSTPVLGKLLWLALRSAATGVRPLAAAGETVHPPAVSPPSPRLVEQPPAPSQRQPRPAEPVPVVGRGTNLREPHR